jgi:hypothetical protein
LLNSRSPGVGWGHSRGNHFTHYDYIKKYLKFFFLRTIRPESSDLHGNLISNTTVDEIEMQILNYISILGEKNTVICKLLYIGALEDFGVNPREFFIFKISKTTVGEFNMQIKFF